MNGNVLISAACSIHNLWMPFAGKDLNTLGKDFSECSTRYTPHGDQRFGKDVSAECLSSDTWQSLCRVSHRLSAEKRLESRNELQQIFF